MSDDKLKNDPYSNPDMLKGDVIYPENVEPKTKWSGRIMISTLLIILPLSFVLGMIVFGRLSHNSTVTEVTQYVEVSSNRKGGVWGLSNRQFTTAEGTFTEWIAGSPENDEIPWFRDVAYHAGTDAVYLTANKNGIYVVPNHERNYTTMTFLDLSLRVNHRIEQVIPYDNDHLLLLVDAGRQFALYNVVTDRVTASWTARYQPDTPDNYFQVDYGGVVVDGDGHIHVLQRIANGESYIGEIQLFSNTGEYLSGRYPSSINLMGFLTMASDNTLYIHDHGNFLDYDLETKTWTEIELLPAFKYVNAAEFHPNGSLYMIGGSQAWLAERLPSGEVGIAYPATENVSEMTSWPLGTTGDPAAMTLLPDGSFVIIDGYINDFQRIFRLELPTP